MLIVCALVITYRPGWVDEGVSVDFITEFARDSE